MKIVHLCLACFFPSGHSYQENLLPKYHKKMGYDVEVIASTFGFNQNGCPCYEYEREGVSFNEHGIKVTRIPYKFKKAFAFKFRFFKSLKKSLNLSSPDILFIHGCQFKDISIVVDFLKKHPNVVTYVDNHADFSNSAVSWFSKNIMHGVVWRYYAKLINPFVKKWYGVLPARVDFLKDVYGLPAEKIDFLPMGADDDMVEKYSSPAIRASYRRKYGIDDKDFLIVTGGKINFAKKQTLLLMDAVNQIDNPKLKLIVFGSIAPELKNEVEQRCSDKVKYIGWLSSEESYPHFAMADLVAFSGRHSVFWEQVAGMGMPMLVKYWTGTTHIDMGGNVKFLYNDSLEEIKKNISDIFFKAELKKMKAVAESNKNFFSYRDIAKRCVNINV